MLPFWTFLAFVLVCVVLWLLPPPRARNQRRGSVFPRRFWSRLKTW